MVKGIGQFSADTFFGNGCLEGYNERKNNKILGFVYDNLGMVLYILVWLGIVIYFWLEVSGTEAFGFTLISFYLVLPLASLAVAVYYGAGEDRIRYFIPLICGAFEVLGGFFTFQCANMVSNGRWNTPDLVMGLYTFIPALAGLGISLLIRFIRKKIGKQAEKV